MQSKTAAIVLHLTKHSDSTSILHLYTNEFGRINCVVSGIHSKKSKCKVAFFEPLSLLEVELTHSPSKPLHRIQEARITFVPQSIPLQANKRSIALFLAEILYRTLTHPLADEALFNFLQNAVKMLDKTSDVANFHLVFLLQLSQYLGFYPNLLGGGTLFDLESGERCNLRPLHAHFLLPEQTRLLVEIANANFDSMCEIVLNRATRQQLLESILLYYKIQQPNFYDLHSLDVLTALFD